MPNRASVARAGLERRSANELGVAGCMRARVQVFDHQSEMPGTQKVRVWGDTAVVTALLWLKGTQDGKPFEYKLWFSDTYVRTKAGWKYVFGQASLRLPD